MTRVGGIAAAQGIATGPVFQFRPPDLHVEKRQIAGAEWELQRWQEAQNQAVGELRELITRADTEMPRDQAAIFEAHLLMLQDPELAESIRKGIQEEALNVEYAVEESAEHYAQALERMEDPYLRARAADVRDVARRLLVILLGVDQAKARRLEQPSILMAMDLTPSDTVLLDKQMLLGFCTVEGSAISHTAILARGLGIPAVVGAGSEILAIGNESKVIIDGSAGEIIVDPTDEEIALYKRKGVALATSEAEALARCREPAATIDGTRVEVVANIGRLEDASAALARGAEGVGLLRSEFLYMGRRALPSEDEQYEAYTAILDVFDPLPVVLRTSDIGGDKELPYLELPKELNPFLGVRGARLALQHLDELLRPQLRAALRAGIGHDLRLMFPMVATLSELRALRQELEECRSQLLEEGKVVAERPQVGIMVEIPSAAVMADLLAPEVDFFSIGTNDLTQYVLAADRTNSRLAHLASAFSPAVLRLIQNVAVQAHKHGKWVGVCGELAGEPLAIPLLLGMGVDELSMSPTAIPKAKQIICGLHIAQCERLTEKAVNLASADEVADYVENALPQLSGA